jgi:hypothetical protein
MKRSFAFVMRFIEAALRRPIVYGPPTRSELNHALTIAIRLTQVTHFSSLVKQLRASSDTISPLTLAQLMPLIDDQGIIRVGGRLRYSSLTYDIKHPILLPKSSHLTTLLIQHYHLCYLYGGGPKLILAMLSRTFWIFSGMDAVRRFIFSCIPCTRTKGPTALSSYGRFIIASS